MSTTNSTPLPSTQPPRRESGAPSGWERYKDVLARKRVSETAHRWYVHHVEVFLKNVNLLSISQLSAPQVIGYFQRNRSDPPAFCTLFAALFCRKTAEAMYPPKPEQEATESVVQDAKGGRDLTWSNRINFNPAGLDKSLRLKTRRSRESAPPQRARETGLTYCNR